MATTRNLEGRQRLREVYLHRAKGDVLLMFPGIVCSVSRLASAVLSAFEDVTYRRKTTMLAEAAD